MSVPVELMRGLAALLAFVAVSQVALAPMAHAQERGEAEDPDEEQRGETAPPEEAFRIGPVLVMGVGGLVIGAGVLVFALGVGERSAVEDAAPGTPWADVRDKADRAPTLLTVGQLMMGGGLVLAGAGLTWLALRLAGVRDYDERVGVGIGPDGVVLWGVL